MRVVRPGLVVALVVLAKARAPLECSLALVLWPAPRHQCGRSYAHADRCPAAGFWWCQPAWGRFPTPPARCTYAKLRGRLRWPPALVRTSIRVVTPTR